MPCSACGLGALWGLVAPHVFASMTTVRTDTNAVSTTSRVAAAIAPMLSGAGGRARGRVHWLAYASPIRVTSQRVPRRSRYSSSGYGGPPAAWRVAIARTLSGPCSVTSTARMVAGRTCWVGVGRAGWRRRSRRSSGAAALSVRVELATANQSQVVGEEASCGGAGRSRARASRRVLWGASRLGVTETQGSPRRAVAWRSARARSPACDPGGRSGSRRRAGPAPRAVPARRSSVAASRTHRQIALATAAACQRSTAAPSRRLGAGSRRR